METALLRPRETYVAIEFSCPKCRHLLRTSEEKAGLSAKCPACGAPIWVPYPHEVPPAASETEGPGPPDLHPARPEPDPWGGTGLHTHSSGEAGFAHAAGSGAPPEPGRGERHVVHCPQCAAENDDAAPVCRFCGSSLEGVRPTAPPDWRPPRFDVSEIMSTAWRLYTQEIGLLIGCQLLFLLSIIVMEAVLGIPVVIALLALQDDAAILVIPFVVLALPFFIVAVSTMMIGLTRLYLNVARGQPRSIGDLYYGFTDGRRFIGRGLLVWITATALILVGTLLCCIPGLIVALCWWPALPLLLDRDCPAGDAIGRTYELVKQRFGAVIAVGAIAFAVQMVAAMVPYLGVILQLFAMPFALLMTSVAYLRLTDQKTAFD